MNVILFIKKHKLFLTIALLLFVIPLFWLKPGELDLGGDSSRLFFYDPVDFLKSSIFWIPLAGLVHEVTEPYYTYVPYVSMLALIRFFFSATAVINLSNSVKLSVSFAMIFFIVFDLLGRSKNKRKDVLRYITAILSGLFYISSLGSLNMEFYWGQAITSHNQIFLNPLLFYLLYKFIQAEKTIYLWVAILLSFVFAPSFGLSSAPPFFAFYPLTIFFLLIYTKLFSRKSIPWSGLGKGLILFLGIHSFQYIPLIVNGFNPGSFSNARVFDKQHIVFDGVNYFMALRAQGKAVLNFFLPSGQREFWWTSIVPSLLVFAGYFYNKKVRQKYLLISIFFIITLFLTTANVTNVGYELYRRLFYLPGFSIFRVYFTQWLYVFIFFYSLLLGFSIFSLLTKLKYCYGRILIAIILGTIVLSGQRLFSGVLVTKAILRGSLGVNQVFKMDRRYEEVLVYIRSLPADGKFLVLPLTDFYFQVISGSNGGAYEGTSTLMHLTDKYGYVGYQDLYPYPEDIMKYAREKNYDRLLRIFTVLNVRYILYNSDPKSYEEVFNPGPFGFMMTSLPKTQNEYQDFLTHFPLQTIYNNGPYTIYEIDKSDYNPTVFIPEGIYPGKDLNFEAKYVHSVSIDSKICENQEYSMLCHDPDPLQQKSTISFKILNPAVYTVNINRTSTFNSVLLVLQHKYHRGWKLEINGKYLDENKHVLVNGYANGWIVDSNDLSDKGDDLVFIKFDQQKYFWYGSIVTIVSIIVLIISSVKLFLKKYEKK